MVKSETRRDADILVRNPSPRLFGKKFRDSKKVKTNHAKTRLRDLSKTLLRFRDPANIFRDPRFSRYHSPPLDLYMSKKPSVSVTYENERTSIKNSLPCIKCVLHLSCVVHGPIYGRFRGCTVNGFLSLYKESIIERANRFQ